MKECGDDNPSKMWVPGTFGMKACARGLKGRISHTKTDSACAIHSVAVRITRFMQKVLYHFGLSNTSVTSTTLWKNVVMKTPSTLWVPGTFGMKAFARGLNGRISHTRTQFLLEQFTRFQSSIKPLMQKVLYHFGVSNTCVTSTTLWKNAGTKTPVKCESLERLAWKLVREA